MNLDPQQKEAVLTESNRALVLAGAGSGKTRVLTERIAHLLENKQVSPYEVMAFTFTRKSAGEIKKRLVDRVGPMAHHITMGTMHGVALDLIQRFAEMIGYRRDKITVYSQWEEDFLLKDIAIDLGYHTGKSWKKIKKSDIQELLNGFYHDGFIPSWDSKAFDLLQCFLAAVRANNSLTYGTILTEFKMLLPLIMPMLNIKYVLVDEVQDIDPLQWSIINMLTEKGSLFAVGDLDQSIYAFRGADPGYLLRDSESFDIYKIETNYRSGEFIVKSANRLISHNRNRFDKTMTPTNLGWGIIDVMRNMDSEALSTQLADPTCENENIAILSRNHVLLVKLSKVLTDKGIKHTYVGNKTTLVNSETFRRFHAFLKLIVNPYDNFSFLLIRDLLGITRETYNWMKLEAARQGLSHYQIWEQKNGSIQIPYSSIDLFGIIVDTYFQDQYTNLLDISDFMTDWFTSDLAQNATHDTISDIKSYLKFVSTYNVNEEAAEEDPEGIQLMTIHASKGLEFPIVIIAGCNEGILPSKRSEHDMDELESERRLAYVGWTRAKDLLVLTVRPEETITEQGFVIKNPISRFIAES